MPVHRFRGPTAEASGLNPDSCWCESSRKHQFGERSGKACRGGFENRSCGSPHGVQVLRSPPVQPEAARVKVMPSALTGKNGERYPGGLRSNSRFHRLTARTSLCRREDAGAAPAGTAIFQLGFGGQGSVGSGGALSGCQLPRATGCVHAFFGTLSGPASRDPVLTGSSATWADGVQVLSVPPIFISGTREKVNLPASEAGETWSVTRVPDHFALKSSGSRIGNSVNHRGFTHPLDGFQFAHVAQPAEARRRGRRGCGCESRREHQSCAASIRSDAPDS